jgi:hypothetical protein
MTMIRAFLFWFIAFFLPFDWIVSGYAYWHGFGGLAWCFAAPAALSGILFWLWLKYMRINSGKSINHN